MIEKTKTVFYCSHCKRHGLSRPAMVKHEHGCTLNPDRVCRWGDDHPTVDVRHLAREISGRFYAPPSDGLEAEDVDWLRDEVDGCPACMLAAFRQSGVQYHHDANGVVQLFDYGAEVEVYRDAERARDYRQQEEDDYRSATYG